MQLDPLKPLSLWLGESAMRQIPSRLLLCWEPHDHSASLVAVLEGAGIERLAREMIPLMSAWSWQSICERDPAGAWGHVASLALGRPASLARLDGHFNAETMGPVPAEAPEGAAGPLVAIWRGSRSKDAQLLFACAQAFIEPFSGVSAQLAQESARALTRSGAAALPERLEALANLVALDALGAKAKREAMPPALARRL